MKSARMLLCSLLIFCWAIAGEYTVDSTAANQVKFFARATLGSFTGVTDRITGAVQWDTGDSGTNRVHLEVDLGSLDTGNGKRNKHMREKYLETDTFPSAVFDGTFSPDSSGRDSIISVQVRGTLTIHGTKQPISVKAKLLRTGENVRVLVAFPLNIRDFKIKKPRFLLISMNEIIRLQLDFFLRPRE